MGVRLKEGEKKGESGRDVRKGIRNSPGALILWGTTGRNGEKGSDGRNGGR